MSDPLTDKAAHDWSPGPHSISLENFEGVSHVRRGAIVVTHPTAPFVRRLAAEEHLSEALLALVAHAYLVRLDARLDELGRGGLGLPPTWLPALDPSAGNGRFNWLPVRPSLDETPGLDASSATASHNLQRRTTVPSSPKERDKTIVLVAGERLVDSNGVWRGTRSGFGLKVVLHVRRSNAGIALSISSMTAHLPQAPYRTMLDLPESKSAGSPLEVVMEMLGFEQMQRFTQTWTRNMAEAARLSVGSDDDGDGLVYDELRFFAFADADKDVERIGIELSGLGNSSLAGDRGTAYRFTVRLRPGEHEPLVEVVSRRALVAGVYARVFEQDPQSRRDPRGGGAPPVGLTYDGRPSRDLDRFRSARVVPGTLQSAHADFTIRNCPEFVYSDQGGPGARQITERAGGHEVRSNDQSAVAAYHNCNDVFGVVRGFGLAPELLFRACVRPVDVFYRSGVRPGPGKSGHTINAWVRLRKPNASGFLPEDRPGIELHLALGNLNRRWRDLGRSPEKRWAEPLGIANSERWMMHEFGHVFIAAALGDPEFRFAHSVGDGMAAIWADPTSRLGDPGHPNLARIRGYTYPWVFTWRRHDRAVLAGWSWSGSLQRFVTEAPEEDLRGYKGYLSEQILSTTLFRIYRCLGGDTVKVDASGDVCADITRRLSASRVVLYLIIRAIESFGHVPLRAEELEAAMIDADLGLSTPLETLRGAAAPSPKWIGGRAHKVIRWAFEAQGMHPPGPGGVHDAPGTPPRVDIFVADGRIGSEDTEYGTAHYGPGSYAPVSFDWTRDAKWINSGPDPLFQIGNRGDLAAANVALRVWVGMIEGDFTDDGWDAGENIRWLVEVAQAAADVPGGRQAQAIDLEGAFASLGEEIAARLHDENAIVLIEVSCPDDRANSDPLAGLPTAITRVDDLPKTPRELADLVVTDNNLGLWRSPAPVA